MQTTKAYALRQQSVIISLMRLDFRRQNLTLVALVIASFVSFVSIVSAAAPMEDQPGFDPKHSPKEQIEPRPYEFESIEMRELSRPSVEIRVAEFTPTRIIRKHSRTVLTGLWTGALIDKTNVTSLGFRLDLQNDNRNETGQSFGLTVLMAGLIGAHWDYHVTCCLGDYNEPYWGVGVTGLYDPSEMLAGLVNIDRYRLRARVGLEDVLSLKRRFRLESALEWGTLGFNFNLLVGWTFDQSEFLF